MTTTTAESYRNAAAEARNRAEESFDRCDTDGFLSQWAAGLTAKLNDRRAEIADRDGMAEFTGLYFGAERVPAKRIKGQYGIVWLLRDDAVARFGRRFVPVGERSRVQRSLGLSERRETAPAFAAIRGRGTGLSGHAWVATLRDGDEWGMDATT